MNESTAQSGRASAQPLVSARGVTVRFPVKRGLFSRTIAEVRAVDGVDLTIGRGETLGLVGESGCGKTTLGRALLRLVEPNSGEVYFGGRDLLKVSRPELRKMRQRMQIVFQDPYASLNPRLTVAAIVGEGLTVHKVCKGAELRERVTRLLETVGLTGDCLDRYPHEFSGGQRQRIGIARALSLKPRFIVCDEAVSALDVSVQAQILNLLMDLKDRLGLSYLFISHDLSVVRQIADRIAVMYLGKVVEEAPTEALFCEPRHPYTRALLSAVPVPDPDHRHKRGERAGLLEGEVPSALKRFDGCGFHTRCPARLDRCRLEEPPWKAGDPAGGFRCFLDTDDENPHD